MQTYELKVKLTFPKGILGTQTGDPEIYRSFIGSKAPDSDTLEEEIANLGVDEVVDKGKTFFPRNKNGEPFIYDYQLRGFFKSACKALSKIEGTKSSKVKAYKQHVDLRIFVKDRENVIKYDGEITECQRPLRCSTMQGERISLANSELIPEDAMAEFTIITFDEKDLDLVKEWLDYGWYNGLLQWRNSGFGSFYWEELA